jgi:hypothetical protein
MGFLRRFLGGNRAPDEDAAADGAAEDAAADGAGTPETSDLDDEERTHQLELARFEQARSDDLIRRQQLYADRSWTPPAQGSDRRAEDEDASRG